MRSPLKVIAVCGALVNDDLALQAGDRFRFVGRSPTATPREGDQDKADNRALEVRFPPMATEHADDAAHRYILKALRNGSVLPCDENTAARAGVPFKQRTEPRTVRASTPKGAE